MYRVKFRIQLLLYLGLATLLYSALLHADVPSLCDAAAEKTNYNTDFLDNFITLKAGKPGWLFRNSDLKVSFGPDEKYYKELKKISTALKRYGTTLMMVPIPTRGISQAAQLGTIPYHSIQAQQAYHKYLNTLRSHGIIVPEIQKLFRKKHQKALFFKRDHHWTSYGAQQVAKITAQKIRSMDLYRDIEKINFKTVNSGKIEMDGSHQKAAAIICATHYDNEIINAYSTESTRTLGLFDEVKQPEVVLVGTSNSNSKMDFNFSGFLMQYSKIDILNLAKSGGGYDGALRDYLKSREFKSNPPKLLIWELPGYYRLNSNSFYKEILRLLKKA